MSSIAFGSTYSFLTSATPSQGWVIGFDTDGILKQKDSSGNVILIGGGPTAGNLATYSISQVLSVGNNTQIRSIIMGTATTIKSANGGGKIELDRLGGTNSILISSDDSSQLESYLILKNDSAKLSFNSSKQMIDLDGNGNQISIYNNNAGSITLGVDTGTLIYERLDEVKIFYNSSSTASTGNYDKSAVFVGSKNSKILPGVVNSVVLGGQNFTASNSNSVYVPDIYLQNQKAIRSTDSNEVFYLKDSNGYTLLDKNSGNLDSSWLLMATDYLSTYQAYVEIGVNSDSGYGNDSQIYIHNSKGPSFSYQSYSNITIGKNILRLASQDVDGSSDTVRISLITGNSIIADGSTSSFKGIEYNDDYSLNFVTHSLVDKSYVDSQFTGFNLDVILSAGNNSESNDIVLGTATVVKSANGGGQIDLDLNGTANEVSISTDNGALADTFISLSTSDLILQTNGAISLNAGDLLISSNNLEGVKYQADYSATFVTQSLVDKGYVDSGTSSIWSAIDSINLDYISEIVTGSGLTGGGTYGTINIDVEIGNGLEFVTNSIYLGGTLSQDTIILGDSYNFTLDEVTNISLSASGFIDNYVTDLSGFYGEVYLDSNVFDARVGTIYGNTFSRLITQNHVVLLENQNETGDSTSYGLYLNPQIVNDGSSDNRLIINDEVSQKGIVYQDDYTSNFTTFSVVTKGYVDSIPEKVDNGLTFSSGFIGLGGTLSRDVTIDGYGFELKYDDLGRFNMTASTYINHKVFSASSNTSQQIHDGDSYLLRVEEVLTGTYSGYSIQPNAMQIESADGSGFFSQLDLNPVVSRWRTFDEYGYYSFINLYGQDQSIADGSTNNRLIVGDDANNKGLVYDSDYTANFTTYSLVTKGYVDSQKPYKVYTALITQTSTNNPTVTILENTLGYTPTLTRNLAGIYGIGVTSTTTNFLYFLNNNSTNENIILRMGTSFSMGVTSFVITTKNSGVNTDGLLNQTPIEIRIYN